MYESFGVKGNSPQSGLGGNVDPINSLLMGTKEQVVADTLNCLCTGGTSRFILMTGCGVPAQTPVENMEAMIRTANEYGLGQEVPCSLRHCG